MLDISIIVPTHDRSELLRQCLESITRQEYPADLYEVIVVLDGSYPPAERFLEGFVDAHPHVRYIVQKARGPAAARNLGVSLARAEILGFVDDDCIVSPGWIHSVVDSHRRHPDAAAVGGSTVVGKGRVNVAVSQFLANCAIRARILGREEIIFFPTCNISYKKRIFEQERFDEAFPLPAGEDLEHFWRLFKSGRKLYHCPEMEVLHDRQGNLRSFLRQAFMYGRGNYLVQYMHRDHPLLKEIRIGTVAFWFAALLNVLKIPRFSLLLGRRLIAQDGIRGIYTKAAVFSYFTVHKIFYVAGTIAEFFRARRDATIREKKTFPVPRLLILDVTHCCNLTCKMCDIWQTGDRRQDMELELVKSLISQSKELGIPEVALSGGEPLLRADIYEIFDHARKLGVKKLGLLTNGIAVGERMERLAPYFEDGTVIPMLSLDSLSPAVHDHIRNLPGAWDATTKALTALSALKRKSPLVGFGVITIVLNRNLDELAEIAAFVKSLGADSLQFQALLPNNMRMAERKCSEFFVGVDMLPRLDRAIDALKELKKRDPGFIRNSEDNLHTIKDYFRGAIVPERVRCRSGESTVLVSNRGECTTCFACYGNARETELAAILAGSEAERAREQVKKCRWPCLLPCFCDMGER